MHGTHLPLTMWMKAMFLMACFSRGISALKLSQQLGIQYRIGSPAQ